MTSTPIQRSDSSTSASLIRRVQSDDRPAWEKLSKLYGPVVYEWARQNGLQPQDAADVMQDVFQSLAKNINKFSQEASGTFRGWLWTVSRNKVQDHFRRKAGKDNAAGGSEAYNRLLQMPDAPPLSDSDVGQVEASGIHQRALELMKTDFEPQTWQAFWRTTIDGTSPADVARDLGVSKWTVYKARSRVLQRLREEFADLL